MTSSGPGQILSSNPSVSPQRRVVDALRENLKLDVEQGIIVRTQSSLAELGVMPMLPPKTVGRCLKKCDGDPVRFLFLAHKCLVAIEEEEYEAKYTKAKRKVA